MSFESEPSYDPDSSSNSVNGSRRSHDTSEVGQSSDESEQSHDPSEDNHSEEGEEHALGPKTGGETMPNPQPKTGGETMPNPPASFGAPLTDDEQSYMREMRTLVRTRTFINTEETRKGPQFRLAANTSARRTGGSKNWHCNVAIQAE